MREVVNTAVQVGVNGGEDLRAAVWKEVGMGNGVDRGVHGRRFERNAEEGVNLRTV